MSLPDHEYLMYSTIQAIKWGHRQPRSTLNFKLSRLELDLNIKFWLSYYNFYLKNTPRVYRNTQGSRFDLFERFIQFTDRNREKPKRGGKRGLIVVCKAKDVSLRRMIRKSGSALFMKKFVKHIYDSW